MQIRRDGTSLAVGRRSVLGWVDDLALGNISRLNEVIRVVRSGATLRLCRAITVLPQMSWAMPLAPRGPSQEPFQSP